MKKKMILAVVLAVMMFTLCACSAGQDKEVQTEDGFFMVYHAYNNGYVIIDTQTNVMYWMSTGAYNHGTLTLLVEKNGSPKIYRDGDG